MRLIFGLVVVRKCRKGPNIMWSREFGGIQCRLFSEFLRRSVEAKPGVIVRKLQEFCYLMILPPLLPHLEAVFSVSCCGVRNGAELLRF